MDSQTETMMEDIQGHSFSQQSVSLHCQYQSQQSPDPVKSHPPNALMDFKNKRLTLSPLCPAGPGGPIIPGMP